MTLWLINLSIMSKHHGEILAKAIRQSGYPITKIAKRVGYTRQHFYNLFEKRRLSSDLLVQIGHIIHVDLLNEINSAKSVKLFLKENEDEIDYKELYYSLLEQQNKLVKENYTLLKKLFIDKNKTP